jgi:hypothetical protein
MTATEMLATYPKPVDLDRAKLAAAIDALTNCAQTCTACADACLAEDMVAELTTCIRTNLDCADVCTATARVLSRRTGYNAAVTRSVLEACLVVCHACAEECGKHATMHEHCRVCAHACRACEKACRELLATLS